MRDGVGLTGVRREWREVVGLGTDCEAFARGSDDGAGKEREKRVSVSAGPQRGRL